jgi:hypothetical protein
LEIISPAGFENYFRELGAELVSGAPDPQRLAALCASYALDMDKQRSQPHPTIWSSLSGSAASRATLKFAFEKQRDDFRVLPFSDMSQCPT